MTGRSTSSSWARTRPGGATATKQIRAAGINLPIIGGAGFDGTFWLERCRT